MRRAASRRLRALPWWTPVLLLLTAVTFAVAASIGSAASEAAQTEAAASSAPSIPFSVGGRAHEVDASGRIPITGHLPRGRKLLAVLQQRIGGDAWRSRAATPLRRHDGVLSYALRWRRPPAGRPLTLRVIVTSRGHVLARSGVRVVSSGDPGAVFYSGEGDAGAGDVGDNSVRYVASFGFLGLGNHYDGKWTGSSTCDTSQSVPPRSSIGREPITELAGFSLGRLGPIYFLHRASWVSQINYILLLDPGAAGEMQPCDNNSSIAPAATLARWLGMGAGNRLVIMAGPATLSDDYAGLDKYYLSSLTPSQQRQVLICSTGSPDHKAFLEGQKGGFGWMVGAPPPSTCPPHTTERRSWRAPIASAPQTQPAAPKPTAPAAPVNLPPGEFAVMNASGGVYWRSAPDWSTPEAVPGVGFYPGTIVKIGCYQAGAANVPGSADGMWEQASWVSGPGGGSGWINEHFIDDNAPINQPSPGAAPCPSSAPPAPPPPAPQTWSEQETPNHPVNTFTNYHNASGLGPAIAAGQWVSVSCKVYDPTIQSVNPDGYWYRIATSPWNNAYYSPANTFMNGDPYGGPYTHNTDFAVRNC